MRYVVAIIKPHKLDEVREALRAVGVAGLTASDVQGFGRQRGHTEVYRGAEYQVDFVPKIKLEIMADDDQVVGIVDAIMKTAHTGKIGDGKIFVFDAEQAFRIRTGERGPDAI
jgi:nitrogen regulatory protein P-II 2